MPREDRLREAKETLNEARRLLNESKRAREAGTHHLSNSQDRGFQEQDKQRAIMGGKLPLGHSAAGVDSFPGPDVTYTPPVQIQNPMVNLGCLSSAQITDIVPVNVTWPRSQVPSSFATGAEGPLFAQTNGDVAGFTGAVGQDDTPPGNDVQGQPNAGDATYRNNGGGADFSSFSVTNALDNGFSTPFQAAVYLSSDVQLYNIAATAAGYGNITLSQEGVLWTLWPLTKSSPGESGQVTGTYFDDFIFGTAKASRYPIGQMGFFTNNILQGCTPFGAVNTNSGFATGAATGNQQTGLNPYSPGILPGIEGLNQALLITTEQEVAIVCVKVAEEVARIFNPAAGIAASERYIYVGYDAWAVVLTTANPMGPMAAQTYITPQTVTGSVVGNNYQVVVPPNFPTTVYYKNQRRIVPVDTDVGLFAGTAFTAAGTGIGAAGIV